MAFAIGYCSDNAANDLDRFSNEFNGIMVETDRFWKVSLTYQTTGAISEAIELVLSLGKSSINTKLPGKAR
jgi:hypothetical protein